MSPTTPPTVIESLQLKITPQNNTSLPSPWLAGPCRINFGSRLWKARVEEGDKLCSHETRWCRERHRYSFLLSTYEGKQCLYSLQIISTYCEHSAKKNSLCTLLGIFWKTIKKDSFRKSCKAMEILPTTKWMAVVKQELIFFDKNFWFDNPACFPLQRTFWECGVNQTTF